ncbi:LacI family DNA-binding transcriptional regulator [Tepidibacillus marianensis]|uniref:LacI family DNA-binding transcriptional regulator n=1 Tax=Tepidibacillus marianensis TaxID=3131995 RepID=UPI0030D4BC94
MAITIKDVAKLANVNPSTVSRVIANNPRISEKTKRIVREAMEQLGYHPNLNARSLVNRNTQTIGIIMPSSAEKAFQNPFFAEVLRGISSKANQQEYAIYMSTGVTEEEIYRGVVNMVQGRRVDGVILLYSRVNDSIMNFLQEENFPFVVIGKPSNHPELITHVDNDNRNAACEVTDYLIQLGHQNIAFVGGSLELVVTIDRLEGYKQALQTADIAIREEYLFQEEFLKEGGQEAVGELFSLPEPPTALVVTDDLMAFGVLSTLYERGFRVPEDISVVSFNNVMLAEFSRPSLTSVEINIYQLGLEAVQCLIDRIREPELPTKRVIVSHQLIVRDSCQQQ